MKRYHALLQPFQLKGLRLRNRIMSTSQVLGVATSLRALSEMGGNTLVATFGT